MVIGGVKSSINDFSDLNSISPIDGSGFGPTDDGRIKPDLVVPSGAYTSSSASDNSYANSSGTSSSTAAVAGSIALIREHYQNLNTDTLSSASIRALLAHSADDVGTIGPDYKMGWGLMNTERAVRFLSVNKSNDERAFLKDTVLNNGNSIHLKYQHNSSQPLIITITWTDPKGDVSVSGDDPDDIILVNDVDVQVSDPNSTDFYPWILDKDNPETSATTGNNDVDNIEQIVISNPVSGEYTITISHEGSLQSGNQHVSVLISEAEPRVQFSTIADGNWTDSSTWLNGNIPSSITDEAVLKHSVVLDEDIIIGSILFEEANSKLTLSGQSLSLYGHHQNNSGIGFSGDSLSSIIIYNWEENSDPIKFESAKEKLAVFKVEVPGDTVDLGSDLNIYQKLDLAKGFVRQTSGELTLISDEENTASLIKGNGVLITDFMYSRAFTEEVSGWRMISSPVNEEEFSSLNESFFTQGGSWASNMAIAPNSSLWLFDPDNQDFNGFYGADSVFASGKGYLFYMFNTNPNGEQILPASLKMKGSEPDSLSINLFRGSHDSTSYNLMGNPFAGTLDWHEIVNDGTELASSYAVWRPSSGGETSGFKYYNMTGEIGFAGRYIAPMQGFFVQAQNSNAMVTFKQSQKAENEPSKFGKRVAEESIAYINVKLLDESKIVLDDQAHIIFSDLASLEKDALDVNRIKSLHQNENIISFPTKGKEQRVFESRPMDLEKDKIDFSLKLQNTGFYIMNWEKMINIPENWLIKLIDSNTGQTLNLKQKKEYEFYFDVEKEKNSERFSLKINRNEENLGDGKSESPESFQLKQNYPNPFNPSTLIHYELPVDSEVKIEVFDVIGRLVATLVNERKSAGFHSVQFNATHLASGAYFYRINAGDFLNVKPMMLIK